MRDGYRQLRLTEFPKVRSGIMVYVYSEASGTNDSYLKELNKTQELMMETIIDSLKTGRIPMANSIWKKFVKTLHRGSISLDINNLLFDIVEKAYLQKKFELKFRAKLYKILNLKVIGFEKEKDSFKDLYKECKDNSECDRDTQDNIDDTYENWKRRTKIYSKEIKIAKKKLENLYDEDDGFSRRTLMVSKLFYESAETITSTN